MKIETLEIITEPHKLYDTGKKPVLVLCDDLMLYISKHNFAISNTLFNEYIASSFMQIWNIPTPKFVFIDTPQTHVQEFSIQNDLQPRWFNKTCFASLQLEYAKELDDNMLNINANQFNSTRKIDFLKIALFDIWIANEDRTPGHTNLLINPEQNGLVFYAIDHDSIFNSNSGLELFQLNEDETILGHNLFKSLFRKRNTNHNEIIEELFEDLKQFINHSVYRLNDILESIPENWNIDKDIKKEFLLKNLFSENWINQTKRTFEMFYSKFIG